MDFEAIKDIETIKHFQTNDNLMTFRHFVIREIIKDLKSNEDLVTIEHLETIDDLELRLLYTLRPLKTMNETI